MRHTLGGVVDDDGELIGDHAVAAAHDDVARLALEQLALRTGDVVAKLHRALHAHAQRRLAPVRAPQRALARRQVAAGAAVERPVGAVRGRGGAPNVGARAEALVQDAPLAQRRRARLRRRRVRSDCTTGSPSQSRPSQASDSACVSRAAGPHARACRDPRSGAGSVRPPGVPTARRSAPCARCRGGGPRSGWVRSGRRTRRLTLPWRRWAWSTRRRAVGCGDASTAASRWPTAGAARAGCRPDARPATASCACVARRPAARARP